jgi:hypothetical protein
MLNADGGKACSLAPYRAHAQRSARVETREACVFCSRVLDVRSSDAPALHAASRPDR